MQVAFARIGSCKIDLGKLTAFGRVQCYKAEETCAERTQTIVGDELLRQFASKLVAWVRLC